jgi:alkylhydroperoxidase family enzyme
MQQPGRVSRLPPLPDTSDPSLQELFDDTRRRGGQVLNLHLALGHAPKMALARRAVANAIRYDAVTPRLLRELAIVRTAQIVGSDYELNQHVPMALAAGLTGAQLDALPSWRTSDLFDDKQRAVLAYVEQVARGGEVDDATFAALARLFTPQEIVEITITAASYYGTGLVIKALRIEVETDGRHAAPG